MNDALKQNDLTRRTVQIRTDKIKVVWNSRTFLGDTKRLSESIAQSGLISPIAIIEEKDLPDEAWLSLSNYRLISGHRRFDAVTTHLKWEYIECVILKDLSEYEIRLVNLTENVNRKSLRLYDLMSSVAEIHQKFGTDRHRIAKDLGIVYLKIANMIRVWNALAPKIKEKWAKIEEALYEPPMMKLEAWSKLSYSEQAAAWKGWANDSAVEREIEETISPEMAKRMHSTRARRRNTREVKSVLALLGTSEVDQAQKRALLWALGRRSTL